jgi:hypothetical protein
MMSYNEAVDVVKQLIMDNGRGFEWSVYPQYRYDISENAKHLAIKVLDDPANVIADQTNPGQMISMAEALKKAVSKEVGCCIHKDYLYRVIALVLDDDANGNHITLQSLITMKNYRMNVLKMGY